MVQQLSTCRLHRYIYLIKFSFRFTVSFYSINIDRLISTVLAGTHRSLNSQSHVQLIFRQGKRFCQKNFSASRIEKLFSTAKYRTFTSKNFHFRDLLFLQRNKRVCSCSSRKQKRIKDYGKRRQTTEAKFVKIRRQRIHQHTQQNVLLLFQLWDTTH